MPSRFMRRMTVPCWIGAAAVADGHADHDLVVAGDLADRAALSRDVGEDAREQVVARRLDVDGVAAPANDLDAGDTPERRRVEP